MIIDFQCLLPLSLGLDVDDEDAPVEHIEAPAATEAASSSAMEEID